MSLHSFFSVPLMEKEPERATRRSGSIKPVESESVSVSDSPGLGSAEEEVTSSSSATMSCCYNRRRGGNRWWTSDHQMFPPPLTSLSENGRRNFTLKPTRKDGRLEIVGVMIERPEILCASRRNGRLRLHLVQTSMQNNECEDEDEDEEEEDEVAETVAETEEGEEREEWRVVTRTASRRSCHMRETQVWGQQHCYVTSM